MLVGSGIDGGDGVLIGGKGMGKDEGQGRERWGERAWGVDLDHFGVRRYSKPSDIATTVWLRVVAPGSSADGMVPMEGVMMVMLMEFGGREW